jgi:tRNA(adenine34) deaminase
MRATHLGLHATLRCYEVAVANDEQWLRSALAQAAEAELAGEVPVGAVIVSAGAIVAASGNRSRRESDATAHAELLVLRAAASVLGQPYLESCALYVTLEPCAMCAGAIVLARVGRVVFGAWDEKAGMGGSIGDILRHPRLNHRPEVRGGVLEQECGAMLSRFFAARRVGQTPLSLEVR